MPLPSQMMSPFASEKYDNKLCSSFGCVAETMRLRGFEQQAASRTQPVGLVSNGVLNLTLQAVHKLLTGMYDWLIKIARACLDRHQEWFKPLITESNPQALQLNAAYL